MIEITIDMIDKLVPVKFHPYTSATTERIITIDDMTVAHFPAIYKLENKLLELFNNAGIKCETGNKIVFECRYNSLTLYFGFYDSRFSIGLGVINRR